LALFCPACPQPGVKSLQIHQMIHSKQTSICDCC
jgi:hypothetical protein